MAEEKRKVRSVRIQVCDGGWTCDVEREPEKQKGKDACMSYCWEPTTPQVFTDKEAMLKTIGDLLGGGESKPSKTKFGRAHTSND